MKNFKSQAQKNYADKLKDPRWLQKREEILIRDEYTCRYCGGTEDEYKKLHVHHIKYQGDPWEIDNAYLLTLCRECHDDVECLKQDVKTVLEDMQSCLSMEKIYLWVKAGRQRVADANGDFTYYPKYQY